MMSIKKNLYKEKENSYFSNIRKEIASLLPKNCENILDLGCGDGSTLGWLKKSDVCKKTYGIDISKTLPDKSNDVDYYISGDLEECETFFENTKFDLILILDVLEHLIDPDSFIQKTKKSLGKNGLIIFCIPNIRHYSIFKNIFLKGDFQYTGSGILDRTHLRFFTKKSFNRFLNYHNLSVKKIVQYPVDFPSKSKIFNLLTLGLFSDFLTQQYFFQVDLNE